MRKPLMIGNRACRADLRILALLLIPSWATAQQPGPLPAPRPEAPLQYLYGKPATEPTKAANDAVRNALPFDDRTDFADARRGLLLKGCAKC